jgi:uncharacterized protein YndB with AHSA1/START domain
MTEVETQHELVLVNRYDASPEQVWEAWTEPENFVQWCVRRTGRCPTS